MTTNDAYGRVALAGGGVFGIGLAALLDVIVFHHILQTHHLLSNRIDPTTHTGLQQNVYYDGLFSLLMLGVLLVGASLLWWAANRSGRRLRSLTVSGSVLLGMGLFNTIDGLVSHYLLDIHDVVHETTVWNPPWVLVSVLLFITGALLVWRGRGQIATEQPE